MTIFTTLGFIGVAINLAAYGLLTAKKIRADQLVYQVLNIIGTVGILLSLITQWNLPVFLGNIAWFAVAIVGFSRILHKRGFK